MATSPSSAGTIPEACPACGWHPDDASVVCIFCGVVLRRERLGFSTCEGCRAMVLSWQSFCMRCGIAVEPDGGEPHGISPPSSAATAPLEGELLQTIRGFATSRRGAIVALSLAVLALIPWFLPTEPIHVGFVVPASGGVTERSVGEIVDVTVFALNAAEGSTVEVFVDGQPLADATLEASAERVFTFPWTVGGTSGTTYTLSVRLTSPEGTTIEGDTAIVLIVD